jgi:MFS transporter, DHA1 family, multidrug resistance protein
VAVTATGIFQVFCATFASAILAAPTSRISKHFNVSVEVGSLVTTLYLLGFVCGPSVFGPFSELYGRRIPMVLGAFGFLIFGVATAVAKDIQTLMICRFFQGVFGSSPIVVLAAVCADIWRPESRGPALICFATGAFLPPMVAPFVSAFTAESSLGWRFDSYWTVFLGAASLGLSLLLIKESYPPVVLIAKAKLLRRRTGNWAIYAKQEQVETDVKALLEKNLTRPLRMLIQEPILALCGIYISFVYGLMYMTLAAYSFVFQGVHQMKPGVGSLPFLGIALGMVLSGAVAIYANGAWIRKFHANNSKAIPEWRMPLAAVGAVVFAIGILWFGWSGNYRSVHWIVPSIAGAFVGFGLLLIFMQLIMYIIEGYLML